MPAKRKEVSPAASPQKPAEDPDKIEDTLQQYLNLLSIADDLARKNRDENSSKNRNEIRFCAECVIRKLRLLSDQSQYNKDCLLCIFHLVDSRFKRPPHDPKKPFKEWVNEKEYVPQPALAKTGNQEVSQHIKDACHNDKKWATRETMRPVHNQNFLLSVFEEMDKMYKQHFSSQKAEDITEGVNEVLNDLVYEYILEVVVEDPAVLDACIRNLESELFFFEWIIEAIVKNPDGVNYCIRRLESQVYDLEYQLFEILRDLAKA